MSDLLKDYIEMATGTDGGAFTDPDTGETTDIVNYSFIHTASCNTQEGVERIQSDLANSGVSIGDFCSETIERGLESSFILENGANIPATLNSLYTLTGRDGNMYEYPLALDRAIREGAEITRMPNGDMPDDNIILMAGAVAEWAKLNNAEKAGIENPLARAQETIQRACSPELKETLDQIADEIYVGAEQPSGYALSVGKRIASDAYLDVNSANVVSFPDGETVVPDRCPAVETSSAEGRGQ